MSQLWGRGEREGEERLAMRRTETRGKQAASDRPRICNVIFTVVLGGAFTSTSIRGERKPKRKGKEKIKRARTLMQGRPSGRARQPRRLEEYDEGEFDMRELKGHSQLACQVLVLTLSLSPKFSQEQRAPTHW